MIEDLYSLDDGGDDSALESGDGGYSFITGRLTYTRDIVPYDETR